MAFDGAKKLTRLTRGMLGLLLGIFAIAAVLTGAAISSHVASSVTLDDPVVTFNELKPSVLLADYSLPEPEEHEEEDDTVQVSADEVIEHEVDSAIPYIPFKELLHVVETRLVGFYRPDPLPPPLAA